MPSAVIVSVKRLSKQSAPACRYRASTLPGLTAYRAVSHQGFGGKVHPRGSNPLGHVLRLTLVAASWLRQGC